MNVGEPVVLDGSGSSDPDGDALTYSWSIDAAPAGGDASFTDADTPAPTFTAAGAGVYLVELRIFDGEAEDTDTVAVYVSSLDDPLSPGGTWEGPDGLTVLPSEGALEETVDLAAEEPAEPPPEPLPEAAEALSAEYLLRADRDVSAPLEEGFALRLPVPDGADPDRLALALFSPSSDLVSENELVGEAVENPVVDSGMWELVPGFYDEAEETFTVTLPQLTFEGRRVALVLRPAPVTTQPSTLKSHVPFKVTCENFGQLADEDDCDSTDTSDMEGELDDALHDYSDRGLGDPYLKREQLSSGPNNATVGDYLAELHPYISDNGDDDLDLCETKDGIRNNGRYSSGSRLMYICMNDSVTAGIADTARHEYIHAIQYGYSAVRDNARGKWVIEGTAAAAEASLDTMVRATGRSLHVIDEPLNESGDLIHYRAQDFWVWLGLEQGLGVGYFDDIYDQGANRSDVDTALRSELGLGLDAAYLGWVRNQALERQNDLDGALGSTPCQRVSQTSSLETVSWTAGDGDLTETYDLASLESVLVEIDATAGSDVDAWLDLSVALSTTGLEAKFYPEADLGSTDCHGALALPQHLHTVEAGQSESVLLLLSNTSLSSSTSVTLTVDPRPRVEPSATSPYQEVGAPLELSADVSGFESPGDVSVEWSFEASGGTPTTLPTTSSPGETFTVSDPPCDDLLVTATATDPQTGETADGVVATSCLPQTEEALYYADLDRSGTVTSDGQVTLASSSNVLPVGDDTANVGHQANLHFPLLIDPASISQADLTLDITDITGSPASDLIDLQAVHVEYGDTLEAGDYRTAGNVTFRPGLTDVSDQTQGLVTVDVTVAVQDAIDRGDSVQFIVYYSQETDSDEAEDSVTLNAKDELNLRRPALEITYENY